MEKLETFESAHKLTVRRDAEMNYSVKKHEYYNVVRTPSVAGRVPDWGFDVLQDRPSEFGTFGSASYRQADASAALHREWADYAESWAIEDMPYLWRRALFAPHKDRQDRYRLFVFLWFNGMMAHHAVYWVMWHNTYDHSAWSSIVDAANQTLDPEGREKLGRNRIFNMMTQRVERVSDYM